MCRYWTELTAKCLLQMKRIFDLVMAWFLLCFLSVPILVIGLMVRLTSEKTTGHILNINY